MREYEGGNESLVPPSVDTLPINFAVLDDEGTIVWTNRAWLEFGTANDTPIRPDTPGTNYLEVTAAADSESARRASEGLAAVLAGERDEFELEYPCHSPEEKRWFLMRAAGFTMDGDRYVAVAHIDVTGSSCGRSVGWLTPSCEVRLGRWLPRQPRSRAGGYTAAGAAGSRRSVRPASRRRLR